ncbi:MULTISPECIES: NADH-quinone oxidoreductase subunit NuoG [unclassified Halorhodospira]|uniref:NADH-quinone oxidoreductase subunit NuoG n=1 Tax=unclassified Halorhodospira TaxID=2626748 RepID=UPI001EE7DC4E|nr:MULTISPECIES: NADH-quinone oxidoreductase subunit NuoG [unclassified Halorhodospira]MCG5541001.1 NADH-quinone oxidoreductase subunit NuoG [Halorhodospira sp. M39old]MCG5545361.1 NADH-quinone oxidoreductase subunit NuoG [Halorhodospira sp. M38]
MSANEETVTIEVDGCSIEARKGEMLIQATDRHGIHVPRFCYHKHLSVVANCRMCLVEVEKAPKPLPACATPVADGMVVRTTSATAIKAQRGVMEFLLINHPLDCPICDQGGECELQDISMGYGRGISRFTEGKRSVADEDLGPLVATEMTRCIHCTRCVRFLDEVAGQKELGGMGRGEHMEISTYLETGLSSELSGNVIDLCPVGALTNKPFRFRARPWELLSFPAVSPHDGVGSNLALHTLRGRIQRAVPRENEAINETWIADRDRFAIEGVDHADRLVQPMIKCDGRWHEVPWETALDRAAGALQGVVQRHGADGLGGLLAPSATLEELYLAARLLRGLGSGNVDHRLREVDTSDQEQAPPFPYLGQEIAELEQVDAALLVGAYTRHEQPLINHRLRKAARSGAQIMALNPRGFDWNLPLASEQAVAPAQLVAEFGAVAVAVAEGAGRSLPDELAAVAGPVTDHAREVARRLAAAQRPTALLGNLASSHPQAAALRALGSCIAEFCGGRLGVLAEAGNTAGGWLVGAVPHRQAGGVAAQPAGRSADAMLRAGLKGYLLLNVEPTRDLWDPQAARQAMEQAEEVVAITAFADEQLRAQADVLLPMGAFGESAGTYVNNEGRWQSCRGVAEPPGEARPGWRVLRALGTVLGVERFEYNDIADVYGELAGLCRDLRPGSHYPATAVAAGAKTGQGLALAGGVPIYAGDPLVRRALPLQQAPIAGRAEVVLAPQTAAELGFSQTQPRRVRVRADSGVAELPLVVDDAVPAGVAWIPAGLDERAALGGPYGTVSLEAL